MLASLYRPFTTKLILVSADNFCIALLKIIFSFDTTTEQNTKDNIKELSKVCR